MAAYRPFRLIGSDCPDGDSHFANVFRNDAGHVYVGKSMIWYLESRTKKYFCSAGDVESGRV